MSEFYVGIVEDRQDPLMIGRCRVRIIGLHSPDKTVFPTEDLPWAHPVGPIQSASMSGIGISPTGILPGSWVLVIFVDEYQQQPLMLGTLYGIPQTKSAAMYSEATGAVLTTDDQGDLISSLGGEVMSDFLNDLAKSNAPKSKEPPVAQGTIYRIDVINTDTADGVITTYNIINQNMGDAVVATVNMEDSQTPMLNADGTTQVDANGSIVYDLTQNQYTATLSSPDTWSKDQINLYHDQGKDFDGTKTFTSTDEMLNFFETNFK